MPTLKRHRIAADDAREMAAGRRTWAYFLAALGSGGVLISLWLPWYSFRIPAAALDSAEQLAPQLGILGPLIRQGAALARSLGALHLTAWQALEQVDVALVVLAAAAGTLALLAGSGRATGAGRLIAWAGGVALALTSYRTLFPPGPGRLLHAAWGAYLALSCAAAILLAGLLAFNTEQSEQDWVSAYAGLEDRGQGPAASVVDRGVGGTAHAVAPADRRRYRFRSLRCGNPGFRRRGCDRPQRR